MLVYPVLAQTPAPNPPAGPNTWTVDTAHSAAGFSVKHMMVSTVRGTLGPVKGTIDYDGKSVESIKADITIMATGLNTGNDGRDKDLKSPNFFDVAQFPTVTFKSKRVQNVRADGFDMVGDLTIRDVTKEVVLKVDGIAPPIKDPQGNRRVGANATTTINRKDYGVNYNRALEAGGVLIGDEVKINIEIQAIEKKG